MELNVPFDCREDGVVFAHTNAHARPHLCATLTHDDVTWDDDFAAEFFHAKTTTS